MNIKRKFYSEKFYRVQLKNGIVFILSKEEIDKIEPYIKNRKRMTKAENYFLSWAMSSLVSTRELIKYAKQR